MPSSRDIEKLRFVLDQLKLIHDDFKLRFFFSFTIISIGIYGLIKVSSSLSGGLRHFPDSASVSHHRLAAGIFAFLLPAGILLLALYVLPGRKEILKIRNKLERLKRSIVNFEELFIFHDEISEMLNNTRKMAMMWMAMVAIIWILLLTALFKAAYFLFNF